MCTIVLCYRRPWKPSIVLLSLVLVFQYLAEFHNLEASRSRTALCSMSYPTTSTPTLDPKCGGKRYVNVASHSKTLCIEFQSTWKPCFIIYSLTATLGFEVFGWQLDQLEKTKLYTINNTTWADMSHGSGVVLALEFGIEKSRHHKWLTRVLMTIFIHTQ